MPVGSMGSTLADIYVSTCGDDNNHGYDPANSLASVQRAVAICQGAGGGTVHVGQGRFVMAAPWLLPPNVSVKGAGNGMTKVELVSDVDLLLNACRWSAARAELASQPDWLPWSTKQDEGQAGDSDEADCQDVGGAPAA